MVAKKNFMFCVIVFITLILGACQQEPDMSPIESDNAQEAEQVSSSEQLPWQRARYDYSYLEKGLEQANQYLVNNKLTLKDLKQLHEIANIVGGDYLTKLVLHFEERSADLMDPELFHSEYVKRELTFGIVADYGKNSGYKPEYLFDTPYVRVGIDHLGERRDYVFMPLQLYSPREGGDGDWKYIILQLKKEPSAKYGWKIYYVDPWIEDQTTGKFESGPWTIIFNDEDDFSESAWLQSEHKITNREWEYLIGEKDTPRDPIPYEERLRMQAYEGKKYNRHAAAAYSYEYALSYNPNYYFWKDKNNTDCANFASQCLAAGGLPQDETWKYYDAGYSSGTSAWRGVKNLYRYLLNSGRGSKVKGQYLYDVYNGDPHWCSLQWGDLIFTGPGGSRKIDWDKPDIRHVVVITHDYHNPTEHYKGAPEYYKISGHTKDVRDKDIKDNRWFYRDHAIGIKIEY